MNSAISTTKKFFAVERVGIIERCRMKALILAAGYATRLWPLTLNRPKPLLRIKNKPIIEYGIDKVRKIDEIDKVYIVTNTKFVESFKGWASDYKINKEIQIVDDEMKSVDERRGSIRSFPFFANFKSLT